MSTIYERIGGADAVNAAVDIFYKKVLADTRIDHFFTSVDMNKQAAKQKKFFMTLFKGEAGDAAGYMRNAHKNLSLTEEHFFAVADHLQQTLNELNVPEDLTDEIMTAAASLLDPVLNR